MSDLYGFSAGTVEASKNQLVNLQAQKTLGEIAAQPADLAYKQALTRDVTEQAESRRAANAQAQALAALTGEFDSLQTRKAQQQLIEGKAASGQQATIADLGEEGKPRSQMQRQIDFADFLDSKGVSPQVTAPIRDKIALGLQHEAAAAHNNAQAIQQKSLATIAKAEQLGQIAGTAAASPQAYMAVLGDPANAKLLPKLSGNFEMDRPQLLAIRDMGMKTVERLKLEAKATEDKRTAALQASAIAKNNQAVTLSKAREAEVKAVTANIIKNGGEKSGAAKEAKDSASVARKARLDAQARKEFPPLVLDPTGRELGKTYTISGGRKARWEVNPATGKPGLNVLDLPGAKTSADTSLTDDARGE